MVDGKSSTTTPASERELTIVRTLDAPPELVWEVWTTPDHMVKWWAPKDCTTPSLDVDIRPGGRFRIVIQSPKRREYTMVGVYKEVVEKKRLVMTFSWEGEEEHPIETLITVDFEEVEGKTRCTFHQGLFRDVKERDDHLEGWTEFFDKLEAYLGTV